MESKYNIIEKIMGEGIDPNVMKVRKEVKIKGNNWKNHKMWLDRDVSFEEIIDIAKQIERDNPQYATIFVLTYLSGSRIHEILPCTYKREISTSHTGMLRRDITQRSSVSKDGVETNFLVIKTRVEKLSRASRKIPQRRWKHCEIPVDDRYWPLLEIINNYITFFDSAYKIKGELLPEEPLFKEVKMNTYYTYLVRHFKLNNHAIRHFRATHLVDIHGFEGADLIYYFGWAPGSPMGMTYTHSGRKSCNTKITL